MAIFSEIFIVTCFAVFLIFWIVTAQRVKQTMERRAFGWNTIVPLIVIFFIILLHVLGIFHSAFIRSWPHRFWIDLLSDFIVLAGLVVTLWSRVLLGGNWSRSVELKKGHELIERGPYAKVRHPIYSGILLMFLGLAVYHASIFIFAMVLLFSVMFWFKAKSEEELLTEHFPDAYPEYKKRTWRLIPYLL
ncbi:MAG TPA: isoprenylcysteine carboxylmethyltransferase family protein [Candidatus Kapabacteria bacterium]|jgi:protein-S-isoprenylcysteine O-methyltransferase Ste14